MLVCLKLWSFKILSFSEKIWKFLPAGFLLKLRGDSDSWRFFIWEFVKLSWKLNFKFKGERSVFLFVRFFSNNWHFGESESFNSNFRSNLIGREQILFLDLLFFLISMDSNFWEKLWSLMIVDSFVFIVLSGFLLFLLELLSELLLFFFLGFLNEYNEFKC